MNKNIYLLSFFFLAVCVLLLSSFQIDYFLLGHEEGEAQLVFPAQVKEGPDGNIYAYDRSDAYIKVYSPNGDYLRKIGGKGEGPGEIKRADGAKFGFTHDGKLYFTEILGGHKWITLMELSGEFYKVLHIKRDEVFGIGNSLSIGDGGFIVDISSQAMPEKKKDYFLYRYPQTLLRIDTKGQIISEILSKNYFKTISSKSDGADLWLPYIPRFTWSSFRNNSILFADGLSTNIKVYNYEGKLIGEIATLLPEPEKVTKKDLKDWRKMWEEEVIDKSWFDKFGRIIEKYKKSVYDKKPNLSGIYSTPDGNILVSGPWSREDKINYWLLNEKGRILEQIKLNKSWLKLSRNFVFLGTSDEEGNPLVAVLRRTGSETEDFQKAVELERLIQH